MAEGTAAPAIIAFDASGLRARRDEFVALLDTREDSAAERLYRQLGWRPFGQADDYACDPDGTLAGCVFFVKRLEGAPS